MPETITIPVEEYKKMLEAQVRIKVFADYVKEEKYSIEKKECGRILGFEVTEDAGER